MSSAVRRAQSLTRLADVCVAEGSFTVETLAGAGIAPPTAYWNIANLVELGLLRKERKIRGQQVWSAPAVFKALDAFAARAGRRTWH